jgi:hypothetical protein
MNTIDEYRTELSLEEKSGGKLYCEKSTDKKRENFSSCESFLNLQKRGCYGRSTRAIGTELRYEMLCREIEVLNLAKSTAINYFELESDDWWKLLPADIIPMPGGVYSDASWKGAKITREKLVKNKLLGDSNVEKVTFVKDGVVLILNTRADECGVVEDHLKISPVLLADFDKDGIAELLIKGYRLFLSESCHLGSANTLGAGYSTLVKKTGMSAKPIVLKYPNN